MAELISPGTMQDGSQLNAPPSMPSAGNKSLMQLANPQQEEGLGEAANDPYVKAVQGVKMMEMGAQLLTVLPNVGQIAAQFVEQLKQAAPQEMASLASGSGMSQPAAAQPPAMQQEQGAVGMM